MGDLLLSKSLLAMLSLKSMRAYEIYSETAERMAEGELLGLERSKDYRMEEDTSHPGQKEPEKGIWSS